MNFKKITFLVMLVFLQNNLNFAQDESKDNKETTKTKQYKGRKIDSPLMKIFNSILVQFPTTTLRMTVAAQRAQIILNNIEKLKRVGVTENGKIIYFDNKNEEEEFIKEQLKSVLEPVERFFENVKEHMSMVKGLLAQSLTEDKIENSIIYRILTNVEDSFLKYSCSIITSIPELEKSAKEFVVFFADINASLNDDAKKAFFTFIKNNPNIMGKK